MNTIQELQKRFQESEPLCSHIVELMGLLSTKIRFRIICALSKADLTVGELLEVIGRCKQSNMSLQLKQLMASGAITVRAEGTRHIYSMHDERLRELIAFFEKTWAPKKEQE